MATKDKNFFILLIFLLSGLVVGGLIGELAAKVDWLWWLAYGEEFGISTPVTLDLSVLKISLMIAMRKFDKENQGFQVKEDLKKEMMAKAGQK